MQVNGMTAEALKSKLSRTGYAFQPSLADYGDRYSLNNLLTRVYDMSVQSGPPLTLDPLPLPSWLPKNDNPLRVRPVVVVVRFLSSTSIIEEDENYNLLIPWPSRLKAHLGPAVVVVVCLKLEGILITIISSLSSQLA